MGNTVKKGKGTVIAHIQENQGKVALWVAGIASIKLILLWFSKIVHFTKHFFFRTPLESYNLT